MDHHGNETAYEQRNRKAQEREKKTIGVSLPGLVRALEPASDSGVRRNRSKMVRWLVSLDAKDTLGVLGEETKKKVIPAILCVKIPLELSLPTRPEGIGTESTEHSPADFSEKARPFL